jgi:predicted nucleic acid-binding protein
MPDFSSCVIDTSVIIKALFSPSHRHKGTAYVREVKTHQLCVSLLSTIDALGIENLIPRCGLIEIAAVSSRLANHSAAEEICREVETSFTLVPEELIIATAKNIALEEGCPGFDTYFLAIAEQNSIPLFTDDLGMHRIGEQRVIRSWLLRDFNPKSVFP